jgi:hypothetical protein
MREIYADRCVAGGIERALGLAALPEIELVRFVLFGDAAQAAFAAALRSA